MNANELRVAIAAAEAGDATLIADLIPNASEGSDARVALDAMATLVGLRNEVPIAGGGTQAGLCLGKLAVVMRDAGALQRALAQIQADDEESALRARALRGWLDIQGEIAPGLHGDFELLEAEASSRRMAGLVVEVAALRALALERSGRLVDAVREGRRASRMARTEALVLPEYLANIVLGRIRRVSGRPHLSLRILGALKQVVPAVWQDWVDTERVLAGDALEVTGECARRFARILEAARDGHIGHYREAVESLQSDAADVSVRQDAATLASMLDPNRPAAPVVEDWRRGRSHVPPHGLHAVSDTEAGATADATSYVLLRPDGTACRLLSAGLPLLIEPAAFQGTGKRRRGRVPAALPAIALMGGDGIAEVELFQSVWGFAYKKALHANALGLLCHRIRAELIDTVQLEREDGWLRLRTSTPIVIPDIRCESALEGRLLRMLSRERGMSARSAASALGIPLRTAQAVLEELVSGGDCDRVGTGRATVYAIEDTTFREPTRPE